MGRIRLRTALALAAGLSMPAVAQVDHVAGNFEITVIPAAGCDPITVTVPAAFAGPAANHGLTVGAITYTSGVPCATPPTVTLSPGSVFVLDGNTLPVYLKFGPTDVAAGDYPVAGNAVTAATGTTTSRLRGILLPLP